MKNLIVFFSIFFIVILIAGIATVGLGTTLLSILAVSALVLIPSAAWIACIWKVTAPKY